jgi:hypothetical protein
MVNEILRRRAGHRDANELRVLAPGGIFTRGNPFLRLKICIYIYIILYNIHII